MFCNFNYQFPLFLFYVKNRNCDEIFNYFVKSTVDMYPECRFFYKLTISLVDGLQKHQVILLVDILRYALNKISFKINLR